MFKFTEQELDDAKAALEFHGLNGFYPKINEFEYATNNWNDVKDHIQKIDLDTYKPYSHSVTYLLKDDKLVRPIDSPHIQDLIIYTAIVLILRDCVENARLPKKKKMSFSYRAPTNSGQLYDTSNNYEKYRQATEKRLALKKTNYVTTIDITDFFPRIYQHRLENAIESFTTELREREANRILSKKILPVFSIGTSYGIPTGPFASRVLAEAVLVDVDSTLADKNIDFVRWMDDFTIFSKTEEEAKQVIQLLIEWLHKHHGLSINRAKTKIFLKDEFKRDIWKTYDEEHEKFRELIQKMKSDDPYGPIEVGDETEVDGEALVEVFDLALTIEVLPKFGLIKHLLERVIFRDSVDEETRIKLIRKAMDNVWNLEPVFEALAFAISRESAITDAEVTKFCKRIFSVLAKRKIFVPGHFYMWISWLVGVRKCTTLKPIIKNLISETNDDAVRREAILCLAEIGERADIVAIKDNFKTYAPNTRIALITASRKLGKDERGFWKNTQTMTDFYEKLVFSNT